MANANTSCAQIRYKRTLRSKDDLNVTIYPDDGRFPETFRIPAAELRRFAWAILADLVPDEAANAAAESGLSLEQATTFGKVRNASALHPVTRGGPQGLIFDGDLHRVLADVTARGPMGVTDCVAVLARPSGARSAFDTLRVRGFIDRVNPGSGGTRGIYAATEHGREEIARLAEERRAA